MEDEQMKNLIRQLAEIAPVIEVRAIACTLMGILSVDDFKRLTILMNVCTLLSMDAASELKARIVLCGAEKPEAK